MVSIHLPADPRSPRQAREFTRLALGEMGVRSSVVEDAELVVTEIVTNAVIHAGTPILLELSEPDENGSVRIRVTDYSKKLPLVRSADPSSPTGRGLHIVAQLASSWSVDTRPDHKVVEVVLDAGAPRISEHAC